MIALLVTAGVFSESLDTINSNLTQLCPVCSALNHRVHRNFLLSLLLKRSKILTRTIFLELLACGLQPGSKWGADVQTTPICHQQRPAAPNHCRVQEQGKNGKELRLLWVVLGGRNSQNETCRAVRKPRGEISSYKGTTRTKGQGMHTRRRENFEERYQSFTSPWLPLLCKNH